MSESSERAPSEPKTTYICREMEGTEITITAASPEDARQQAEEWLRGGDYGEIEETIWVYGHLGPVGPDGEVGEEEELVVDIDPEEPGCRRYGDESPARGHDWEEGPVRGHGGGVVRTDACRRCGIRRVSDSWAQDPETGRQGLASVRYDPAEPEEAEP